MRCALCANIALERLTFVHASLPEWQSEAAAFEAIVTPFFLDCLPPRELAAVITTLSRAAQPEARWLVADFTIPDRGLARLRACAVHRLMYAFFRRVTKIRAARVTAPDALLAAEGFQLLGRRTFE